MVRITFLGTAGDNLVCTRQSRASGGIIFSGSSFQYHLNPGPGALVKAKEYGIDLRETTAIFATSPDILCCNDLNAVICAMTYNGMDPRGSVFIEKSLNSKDNPYLKMVRNVVVLSNKQYVKDTELIITQSINGVGIKFCFPKSIAYPGDSDYSEDTAERLKGAAALILNMSTPQRVDSAKEFLKHISPGLGILTCFGIKMSDATKIAREIQARTRIRVIAAEDGMTLDLEEKGQKVLSSFMH